MATKSSKKKQTQTTTWRDRMRYIVPPFVGIAVILVLVLSLNSQLVTAKIKHTQPVLSQSEASNADNTILGTKLEEDTQPTIRIAKVGVQAPITVKEIPEDEAQFQAELQYGVVHYPNTALPGNPGNVVIFGHSSGVWWTPGDYKFVFSQLDKLEAGDKIFIDFDAKRFMYEVTGQKVVEANDVSVLQPKDGYNLTLITCYPVGSDKQRLIITARQVYPDPAPQAEIKAIAPASSSTNGALPGRNESVWDAIRSVF